MSEIQILLSGIAIGFLAADTIAILGVWVAAMRRAERDYLQEELDELLEAIETHNEVTRSSGQAVWDHRLYAVAQKVRGR